LKIARFVIRILRQLSGTANPVLSLSMTQAMLKQQKAFSLCCSDDALGVLSTAQMTTMESSRTSDKAKCFQTLASQKF
jgi:hypothetical protein